MKKSTVKFKNKYRISSNRLPNGDYTNRRFFVTICTDNRAQCFGEVVNNNVILNELGKYAKYCWEEIPHHFKFVRPDLFVIMPDHIHGILFLDNIVDVVRGFKIGVTKYARQNNILFKWQSNYHDRIIRNETEYKNIKNYILKNPQMWGRDRNNS